MQIPRISEFNEFLLAKDLLNKYKKDSNEKKQKKILQNFSQQDSAEMKFQWVKLNNIKQHKYNDYIFIFISLHWGTE